MKTLKTMFLGFLVILIGVSLLFVLNSAIPTALNPFIQDPLVTLFLKPSSDGALSWDGALSYVGKAITIIRMEEGVVVIFILVGLLVAIIGYFHKE